MSESRNQNAPLPEGTMRVRVRYCECDPMGVAHHGSFIPWLEMARTELLRERGGSYAAAEAQGVFLVVTKLDVRYRRPGRYDDVLEVAVRVVSTTRIKIVHEYEVRVVEREGADAGALRDTGDDVLALANTTLACVDRQGRPQPLPGWIVGEG